MKKVILGFLSLLLAGQVSWAQPVSDMAVIPIGITIQNIMRLTITKGGNIEFVFKSAGDITSGLGPGTAYQTTGTVVTTQNYDLNLIADAAQFANEAGVGTIDLDVVGYTTATSGTGAALVAVTDLANANQVIVDGGGVTTSDTFTINWQCGTAATTSQIDPATTPSGRYTVNVMLSLGPDLP